MLTGITKRDMIIILAGKKNIINIGVIFAKDILNIGVTTAKDIVIGRFKKSVIIIISTIAMRHVEGTLSDLD